LQFLEKNQAKEPRGGGVAGFWVSAAAKVFSPTTVPCAAGPLRTGVTAKGGNSSLSVTETNSCFCSEDRPAATALQRQQGCLPSKVLATASCREEERRLPASMVVQAMDCKTAHCPPIANSRANKRTAFVSHLNTRHRLYRRPVKASKLWPYLGNSCQAPECAGSGALPGRAACCILIT